MSIEKSTLKNSSSIYYWSSRFFPKAVRDDVFKLYSFIRTVKEYSDAIPADIEKFEHIEHRWQTVKADLE